jgi:hypothetical protein
VGWIHLVQNRVKLGGGSLNDDNEPSISIKGGEFLDQLSDYHLLKKDSALQS